jgi:hypothetical protein
MVSAEDISHIDTLQWNSACLQLKLTASDCVSLYFSSPPSLSLSENTQLFRNKVHCCSLANHNTENYKVKMLYRIIFTRFLGQAIALRKMKKFNSVLV